MRLLGGLGFNGLCLLSLLLVTGASPANAQHELAVWQAGPDGSGDNTFVGFVEQPPSGSVTTGASFVISGWLVDTTAQGWSGIDQVQVYSGPMGGGGTELATAAVGLDRPDVASSLGNPYWSASGFSAEIDGSALASGVDPVLVYGHTPAKGWWYATVYLAVTPSAQGSYAAGRPALSVNVPSADQIISVTHGPFTISGSAADPQAGRTVGSGIDQVAVYLNGPRADPRSVLLGNADLTGTDWSLTFTPALYPWGSTSLYVYARSRVTGQESVVSRFITIT